MITKDCIETAYSFLHQKRREDSLLMLAVLGGSIGAWLGMKVWHHKTLHKGGNRDIDNIVGGYQFRYGIPAIIIIQLAVISYWQYQ